MNYKAYLQNKGYSETTIESYDLAKSRFIEWCIKQGTSASEIDYKKLLSYTKSLTRKGNSKRTVNHKLAIIKNYFEYLMKQSYRVDNPAEGIIIKGVVKKQLYNLLESEELEDLYYSFETENIKDPYHRLTAKRNKVIIGLMVYQGLNTTSLIQLEVNHVNIYKGKIYIPSSKRTNARELELKPWQVIELLEYIKETREEIKQRKMVESERLFIPNNARLGNTILNIIKKLKKYNSKVDNINQIRASVLSGWTRQYNLRKVQVMAGHRYISSTEKYVQDDLENLQEIINNYHPISE
ncbi:site-specific integrase [Flavobacteriaceae bacterium R38]|nr:site-specific integrase [Flavobacteriaceae bacterium R38]NAS29707.1 site-specific integrase [Flavobacteriaceae bacterium R38]